MALALLNLLPFTAEQEVFGEDSGYGGNIPNWERISVKGLPILE